MTRAIVAAAVHRPSFRMGELSAEGPDEDTFTLAVAAAELLGTRATASHDRIDGLHLVGEFPTEADAGLPEALDAPHVAVERHDPGLSGLGAAFRSASRAEGPGASLVLIAEVARSAAEDRAAMGAGAIVFELRDAPGLAPTGHGGRRHPPHRVPDANGWIGDAARLTGLPPSGAVGTLYFVAEAAPPVLLAFWKRAQAGMSVVPGPVAPPGFGPGRSLAAAHWIADAAGRTDGGEWTVVARVASDETQFLGFRRTGSVEILDAGTVTSTSGVRPGRVPEDALGAVSEGAYVSQARYLENLPSRWRLIAEKCGTCGALTFPVRGRCRNCGRTDALTPEALPRAGTVLAATLVAPGAHPTEFDPIVAAGGAYGVVLAEMVPNVRATFQVTDHAPEPLAVGTRITTTLRRLYPMEGAWRYGLKAVPVASS